MVTEQVLDPVTFNNCITDYFNQKKKLSFYTKPLEKNNEYI